MHQDHFHQADSNQSNVKAPTKNGRLLAYIQE